MEKRGRKFQFNFNNRFLYTFIAIAVIISLGIVVYALAPGVAPNPGHTLSEVAPPAGCASGQVLSWSGSDWVCSNGAGMVLGTPTMSGFSPDTVYQAASDGFVSAWSTKDGAWVRAYTDANNPPTTEWGRHTKGGEGGVLMPVRKGEYWKVTITNEPNIYWIPMMGGGGSLIDTYSAWYSWTAACEADNCNGDGSNPYICPDNIAKVCVDVAGSCGYCSDGQCQARDINCIA